MYRTPVSVHSVPRTPTFVPPADPVNIPRKPSVNAGASVVSSGKMSASKKTKPAPSRG
jgi:hypothetical protein